MTIIVCLYIMDNLSDGQGYRLERDFVQLTYEDIAEDFSNTRYKKWPKVEAFLKSLSPSSLVLDVGCGNGKYMDNPSTFNIGCDLSLNLLKICKTRGFEVVLCDMSRLPFRDKVFDSIICVASLHHVVTETRRKKCLEDIVSVVRPGEGKILVQVWSYEQDLDKNNPYLTKKTDRVASECDISTNEVTILNDLTLPVHKNRTPFCNQDVLVPFHKKTSAPKQNPTLQEKDEKPTRQLRYYHVFKRNELDSMFEQVEDSCIEQSYYDKGNWCVIVSRKKCSNVDSQYDV